MKTKLSICGDRFFINGNLTYSEFPSCPKENHGLLMNARFIQGVFNEKENVERFNRFGKIFNANVNTIELVEALPQWYEKGLRAITVGLQGGGPCFTTNNYEMTNNPFSHDGTDIDPDYLKRMEKILKATDELGMVVIVSYFYGAQTRFLDNDKAIIAATKKASNWLAETGYKNIIIEIANEHDISCFKRHPILSMPSGIVELMEIAKRESDGLPVGCSGTGGYFSKEIAQASDVILIHGNGQTRQQFANLIKKAKAIDPMRPVLCNEDSQAISNMEVAVKLGASWGYYNNMTKQEPPVYWEITQGEDEYFAQRMARSLGISLKEIQEEDQYYLQGLEPHMTVDNKRFIRLASLYPEYINYVEFYRNGIYVETSYDDPFSIGYICNWLQESFDGIRTGEEWVAKVFTKNGSIVTKTVTVK